MREVLLRADLFSRHQVTLEPLSVRERMSLILARLEGERFVDFTALFTPEEGRRGVVVTFLAVLELIKGNKEFAHLPVIMLTSRDSLLDKIKGKMSSSDEYLTKPFSAGELVGVVQRYLRP
jgi:CheY-like chemotaxis protein